MKKVTIFGGSGFVGSYIVNLLAKSDYQVKIATTNLDKANQLKTCGNLGRVSVVYCNVLSQNSVDEAINGSEIVINLVGILEESKNIKFDDIHHKVAKQIAESAKKHEAKKLIHFSALTNDLTSYGASKLKGEVAVSAAFGAATIIKPSVVFGEEDRFFNLFAMIAKKFRILPLISGGKTLLQPVYVSDVARFVQKALESEEAEGRTYKLVGPKKYSLRDIMLFIKETLEIKCIMIPMHYRLALFKAFFLELPVFKPINKLITGQTSSILTREQVRMLQYNNISDENGLEDLSIEMKAVEDIVPKYLKAN